ncbi:MAG: YciI family protein [Acidimicrobiales bacterium]
MAQYLLSVWHDEDYVVDFSGEDAQRMVAQVGAFNEALTASGSWVFAGGLTPASSATVVRSTGGEISMTDGPYAESKEQMGGFWVIEAADLDAALDWARRAAAACEGPVEVRPFQGE